MPGDLGVATNFSVGKSNKQPTSFACFERGSLNVVGVYYIANAAAGAVQQTATEQTTMLRSAPQQKRERAASYIQTPPAEGGKPSTAVTTERGPLFENTTSTSRLHFQHPDRCRCITDRPSHSPNLLTVGTRRLLTTAGRFPPPCEGSIHPPSSSSSSSLILPTSLDESPSSSTWEWQQKWTPPQISE